MNDENKIQASDVIPGGPAEGMTIIAFARKHQVPFWRSIRLGCRYSDEVMEAAETVRLFDDKMKADDIASIRTVRGSHFPSNSHAADVLDMACDQEAERQQDATIFAL